MFDSGGNLWITDANNARILEYNSPFTNGQSASLVLGQTDFVAMHAGTSSNMLSEPYDVKFDNSGNLWIADTANNRILEFNGTVVPEFEPITVLVLCIAIASTLIFTRKYSALDNKHRLSLFVLETK